MPMILARRTGGVNPFPRSDKATVAPLSESTAPGKLAPSAEQQPVTVGCAAAPRFIQVHPRLLALRPEDFAAYVLLCERGITGRYPEGVPISGGELARYFEADESGAAATRYSRALKRLAEQDLVRRTGAPGRKQRYQPLWPGTQRRPAVVVGETYPHRFFIPIYLSLFEQFIGALHPAATGPARIERSRQIPALTPALLLSWANARWAAFKGLPRPDLDPEAVAQLSGLGLLDAETVYDPIVQPKNYPDTFDQPSCPGLQPSGPILTEPDHKSLPAPAKSTTLTLFETMLEQMRRLQAQMAEVQALLASESPATITTSAVDQQEFIASQGDNGNIGPQTRSVNTEDLNTNQTHNSTYHHPEYSPNVIGGGTLSDPGITPTEAEKLLMRQGIVPINARKFANRPPAQVRAAIEYVQKSPQPFKNPAAMIVWLLQQNQFAHADDRPKCWYCGVPGCTRCATDQEEQLVARWYDRDAVWSALWRDLVAGLIDELPHACLADARIHRVEPGKLVVCVSSGAAAIAVRLARREIERAVRFRWGMDLRAYVVIRSGEQYCGTCTAFATWDKQRLMANRPAALEHSWIGNAAAIGARQVHREPDTAGFPMQAGDAMPVVAPLESPRSGGDNVEGQIQQADIQRWGAPHVDATNRSPLLAAAAATGQPPLLQALLGCAAVEPAVPDEAKPETIIVRTSATFIAERLQQQAKAVETVVEALLGYPAQVLIRGPGRP